MQVIYSVLYLPDLLNHAASTPLTEHIPYVLITEFKSLPGLPVVKKAYYSLHWAQP